MDPIAFDRLSRSLAATGTRRGFLHLIAALPLAGALAVVLEMETEAGGRHKRRRKRNTRRSGDDKKNRKGQRKGDEQGKHPRPLPVCSPTTCAPYTQCNGTVCATRCEIDTDCVGTAFCNAAHQCVGDQANGQPCDHGGQCQSGQCVDDVCCASASCDQCQACNIVGQEGTCEPKPNGTVCTTVPCGTCDDSGTCVGCASGQLCSGGACICTTDTCRDGCCDVNGQCQINNVLACGTGGGNCSASCADDRLCNSGNCVTCDSVCAGADCPCIVDIDGSWWCGFIRHTACDRSPCDATRECGTGGSCSVHKIDLDDAVTQLGPTCGFSVGTGICQYGSVCTGS